MASRKGSRSGSSRSGGGPAAKPPEEPPSPEPEVQGGEVLEEADSNEEPSASEDSAKAEDADRSANPLHDAFRDANKKAEAATGLASGMAKASRPQPTAGPKPTAEPEATKLRAGWVHCRALTTLLLNAVPRFAGEEFSAPEAEALRREDRGELEILD